MSKLNPQSQVNAHTDTSLQIQLVTISDSYLEDSGFTESGRQQFKNTVSDYSDVLFRRSVNYGKAAQAKNLPLEIGYEHVRNSARDMADSYGKPERSKWSIAGQVSEYIFTAIAGLAAGFSTQASASNYQTLGILAFVLCLGIVIILIVVRLLQSRTG